MWALGVGARSMLSRRLKAQCQSGGRSCGARLLCACDGEAWCRRAHRWEEMCRLLAHLVGGDLLAWLRCGGWLSWLTAGELSFAFALFRWNFKNKLNDDDGCQRLQLPVHNQLNFLYHLHLHVSSHILIILR